jgi:hypothetical protein
MPEKPSFLDKPEEEKQIEEEKKPEEKKLYTTGRGEVISEREKKDLQKRSWDEIK